MQVTLEKKGALTGVLKIEFTPEDYKKPFSKKLNEYSQKVQMKGFRPGKVPVAMVQKMYGKSLFVEVINDLLGKSLDEYIKEQNLDILGNPIPSDGENERAIDWGGQENYDFSFDLGFAPEVTLPDLSSVSVKKYKLEADDARIDSVVKNLVERYGKYEEGEEVIATDILIGELVKEGQDAISKTAFPYNRIKEAMQPKFLGLKKDGEVEFDMDETFDHDAQHMVTGKKGHDAHVHDEMAGKYKFRLTQISRVIPAEINEELFEKVYPNQGIADEKAFRAKIAEVILQNYEIHVRYLADNALKDALLAQTTFELPEEFLMRWLKARNEKTNPDEIAANFDFYKQDIRWQLILGKAGKDHQPEVKYENVIAHTAELIRAEYLQNGINLDEERLQMAAENYLKEDKGKNLPDLFDRTYKEMVIGRMREQVVFAEETITVSDFDKLPQ